MSLENSFFLKGNKRTVVTDGCFKWIRTPAADGADLKGAFQKSIHLAFQEAREAGIENPVVVGAIPFDPAQPSALFVPKSWESYDTPQNASRKFADKNESEPQDKHDVHTSDFHGHDGYTKSVSDAVTEIRSGTLDKVVLSRLRNITTPKPIPAKTLINRLIQQNSTGFTFHVPLPDGESCLVGTSPELLSRKSGKQFFSQPLAGSAPRNAENEEAVVKSLLESPKDLHEHKLVIDSMKKTLSPRSEELNIPESPACISTSKLWHLATTITGTAKNPDENVLSLACLLHPTPALSGFPNTKALDSIAKLEPFDREYFGGIVGYCDSNGDGEWYIAIRCGKLTGNHVQLFAGAGVVGDSVPESEWKETEVKLSTMMHVFSIA